MSILTISAEIPNFEAVIDALEKAGKGKLQYTKEAVQAATVDLVQRTWIEYASGATVSYSGGTFSVKSVSGEYIRSIQDGLRFPSDLTGEVFSNALHAGIIEDGQPARDMKPGLLASPKAKVNKDGKKWITVPFRHGVPGTQGIQPMPKNVHTMAKRLGFSRRNNSLSASGKKYIWNGRLQETSQGQRSHIEGHPGSGYTWKTGQYSGMVKMGRQGHSQYLTFRRVSENSDPNSWMHPGVEPKPIREAVVENTRADVIALIRRGFEMDLYFMGIGDGQ